MAWYPIMGDKNLFPDRTMDYNKRNLIVSDPVSGIKGLMEQPGGSTLTM